MPQAKKPNVKAVPPEENPPENPSEDDFDTFAKGAEVRPQFYPLLTFPKGEELQHIVTFAEAKPRLVKTRDRYAEDSEDEDPRKDSYAITVRLESTSHKRDGKWLPAVKPGNPDAAMFTLMFNKDPNHGLTNGILGIYKARGTLINVRANLTAEDYAHEKHGRTRGYRIYDLGTARGSVPEAVPEVSPEGVADPEVL